MLLRMRATTILRNNHLKEYKKIMKKIGSKKENDTQKNRIRKDTK